MNGCQSFHGFGRAHGAHGAHGGLKISRLPPAAEDLVQLSHDFCQAGVTVGELYTALMTEPKPREGPEIFHSLMLGESLEDPSKPVGFNDGS